MQLYYLYDEHLWLYVEILFVVYLNAERIKNWRTKLISLVKWNEMTRKKARKRNDDELNDARYILSYSLVCVSCTIEHSINQYKVW